MIVAVSLSVSNRMRDPQSLTCPCDALGTLKGTVEYMAPDFDEPLDDFELST